MALVKASWDETKPKGGFPEPTDEQKAAMKAASGEAEAAAKAEAEAKAAKK